MNALDFLKQEHVKAKDKFKEIEAAGPQRRGGMWEKLKPELEVHEVIERMHLYGPVAQTSAAKGTKLEEWDRAHTEEVDEVKDVIGTMERVDPTSDEWLQNLREVRSLLEEHIAEEENEIWPQIRRVWDASRLEEAGTKMEETHSEKLRAKS
jgi:hemerythrin-like domain-containing protein